MLVYVNSLRLQQTKLDRDSKYQGKPSPTQLLLRTIAISTYWQTSDEVQKDR